MRTLIVWLSGIAATALGSASLFHPWFTLRVGESGESTRSSLQLTELLPGAGVVMLVCLGVSCAVSAMSRQPRAQAGGGRVGGRLGRARVRVPGRASALDPTTLIAGAFLLVGAVCLLVLVITVRRLELDALSGDVAISCLGMPHADCDVVSVQGDGAAYGTAALVMTVICWVVSAVQGPQRWPAAWLAACVSLVAGLPVTHWVVTADGVRPAVAESLVNATLLVAGGLGWLILVRILAPWPLVLLGWLAGIVLLALVESLVSAGTPWYEQAVPGVWQTFAANTAYAAVVCLLVSWLLLGVISVVSVARERRARRAASRPATSGATGLSGPA